MFIFLYNHTLVETAGTSYMLQAYMQGIFVTKPRKLTELPSRYQHNHGFADF